MRKFIIAILTTIPLFHQDSGESLFIEYPPKQRTVTATCYQPRVEQCDGNPFLTANLSVINRFNPLGQRWVAVSRDMLLEHVKYGDSIHVFGTGIYDGWWQVMDCMNKRHKEKIDFLVGDKDKTGRWDNIIVTFKE